MLKESEIIEAMLQRRSIMVRNMTGPGPSEEELEKILRAGTRVPDHGKLTPWRLHLVRGSAQAILGNLFADLFARDYPDSDAGLVAFERNRPQRAPILITVTSHIQQNHKIPELEQLLSGGSVCTTLLYAAQLQGFAAQWVTEWPAFHPEIKAAFGCAAQDHILGFLYIGSASKDSNDRPKDRTRPQLTDVITEWSYTQLS